VPPVDTSASRFRNTSASYNVPRDEAASASCADPVEELAVQVALALAYYGGLVLMMRLAGKRLAGQTTTFDLVVLITLCVVLQTAALREGAGNALVFVGVVFVAHLVLAWACARSPRLRRLVRGAPRPLVRHGEVDHGALAEERMTYEELLAGLRKLGHSSPQGIALATLEETGHISAVARDDGASPT
jgi:uncharacterized membrane protein YcaP (DUF421 family)